MVKAVFTGNKEMISKNLNTPKDGFIQKKRNNKSKQTPAGKVTLINGSKARNNKGVKEQNLQKQTSNSPQKSFEKGKDQRKKGHPNNDKHKEVQPKKDLSKKKITLVEEKDDTDSEIDEDINEGVVLEDQSMVDESENCEDEEKSDDDDDESEEEKDVPNILGNSLADESDEDDDDYEAEEEEEERKNVQTNKGVKMFKGSKQADSSSDSVKNSLDNSALDETLTDDNNEENDDLEEEEEEESGEDEDQTDDDDDDDDDEELEEEDCDSNQDEDEDEGEDEDDDDDDEQDEEDEDEADESALGLKALLDNTIADDDEDDEDFVESGENDEDDDISDEEDEEEEEDGNNTLDNSPQNKNTRDKADASLEKIKTNKRTVFVGNLPIDVKREQLRKLFKKFGTIETIRLRGTVSKSLNVPKKVAAQTKDVHPKLKSVYAYILYATEKSARAALAMNGTVFEGNYIRVDIADKSGNKYDPKKSVFLGNLSFKLSDNKLREHFAQCGEIESVRIVRDNRTGVGKGIGFINFKTEDAATLALELDGTMILNREVRVKPNIEQNKGKKEKHGKRSHSADSEHNVAHKRSKNNEAVPVPVHNKQNAVKRIKGKEQQVGKKQTSPQQGKTFEGQKADASKKKKKNKVEKKKKILAEKLTSKPKKPSN